MPLESSISIFSLLHLFICPGQETYGEDPFLTASLARGFITGLQQEAEIGKGPRQNKLGEPMCVGGESAMFFFLIVFFPQTTHVA